MVNKKFILDYVKKLAYSYLTGEDSLEIENLKEKKGVFVTIHKNEKLRGCIGYPKPYFSLKEGLKRATIGAISQDPRFSPVDIQEFNDLIFEVTILGELILLENKSDFEIGKDGLMIEDSGLLLAQVAIENNFSKKEFLEQTCIKAGYNKNAWKECNVFKFECEIIK